MRITFTRHGESQANLLQEFSNRGLKHPLTPAGRQQAAALAEALQGQNVTHLYSSPVLRAIETTIIVAGSLGVEYEVVEALREYDGGILEGRSDPQAWQMWRALDESWQNQQRLEQRIEGGESFYEVRQRFVPFIERLIQEYGQSQAHLVCVGHGGLYRMMLPLVLVNMDQALITRQGGFGYTAWITSELPPGGLVCTAWNGVPPHP
jgi:broad specificity phosphatase PhoE